MTRLAALLLAALAIAGCGEKQEPVAGSPEPERFTVILDYFPNADHAGLYAALTSGEFRRAGLDVRLVTPPDPSAPLRLLSAGKADLALTYPPEVLLARDRKPAIVSVGALVHEPLTTLMAVDGSGVREVGDLRGKTVGTAGIPYQKAYLKTILDRAGIPETSVEQVDVGFNLVPAMLTKRVDATLGAFWNYEGVDLEQRGRKPTILRMERLGVPTYPELVLAARRESLVPAEAARIRRFIQALSRGAAQVRDDPETAVNALLAANRELERKLQTAAVEATTPLFFPADAKRPFGWQDQAEWHDYGEWMFRNGLLRNRPRAENAVTNEFLPGEGVRKGATDP